MGEERTFWQAYYMSHSELGHRWHLAKTLLTTLQISTHWFLVMTLDYWLTIRYSLFPATPRSCLSIPRKVTLKPDISCGHFFLAMKSILLDKKKSLEHLWFISQDKVSFDISLVKAHSNLSLSCQSEDIVNILTTHAWAEGGSLSTYGSRNPRGDLE